MVIVARLMVMLAMIVAAIAAVRARSLVNAAIALALGNSSLALLFFLLHAPYAGSVQLSVGAGVMSALFLVAISLTESMREVP
ncbi:MAG: DUF4040 domain-containing protein [Chloroflexi bacterium]|nr:DUF4040 domain-containing protein [Chloroflexota bacterium]